MKVFLAFLGIIVAVAAAPQRTTIDSGDAEFVPPSIPRGSSGGDRGSFPGTGGSFPGGFDVPFIIIPNHRPSNRPSLFDIFGFRPSDDDSAVVDDFFPSFDIFPGGPFDPQPSDNDTTLVDDVSPPFNIFRELFGPSPSDNETKSTGDGASSGVFPFFGFDLPIFPDFSNFPKIPGPDDLPKGHDNSTYETKVIDGTLVKINRTQTRNEDGSFIYTQVIYSVSPQNGTAVGGGVGSGSASEDGPQTPPEVTAQQEEQTVPEVDPATNQVETDYEDFGEASTRPLIRRRRGIIDWIKKALVRSGFRNNSLPISSDDKESDEVSFSVITTIHPQSGPQPEAVALTPEDRRVISYLGDTDINYVGVRTRDNPDAEVFDVDLLKEHEDEFFARRPRPISSQPLRSQPLAYQPLRSQPLRSQPLSSQPLRSQPLLSQPLMSQPLMSQPLIFQPLRSQPLRSQPLRSQPLTWQPKLLNSKSTKRKSTKSLQRKYRSSWKNKKSIQSL